MTNKEFIASVSLDGEEWKDIPSLQGCYIASTFGRIISLGRYVKNRHTLIWKKPKVSKQTKLLTTGYYAVMVSQNNQSKLLLVHRLVAEAFLPNPLNYPCVDHIDTNKENNIVSNLRWCSYKGNMNNKRTLHHLRSTQKIHTRKGFSYPVVALENGVCIKTYPSITSVKKDGHDPKRVSIVCDKRGKRHHNYNWMYLSDYQNLINQNVKEQSFNT